MASEEFEASTQTWESMRRFALRIRRMLGSSSTTKTLLIRFNLSNTTRHLWVVTHSGKPPVSRNYKEQIRSCSNLGSLADMDLLLQNFIHNRSITNSQGIGPN